MCLLTVGPLGAVGARTPRLGPSGALDMHSTPSGPEVKNVRGFALFATGINGNPVAVENSSGNGLSNGGELIEPIASDGMLSDEVSYDADLEAFAYKEGRAGACTMTGLRLRNDSTQASVTSNAM